MKNSQSAEKRIKINPQEWTIDTSLDNNKIVKYCLDILNKPTTTIVYGDNSNGTRLYSREQMIEMFKRGFTSTREVLSIIRDSEMLTKKPYSLLRDMHVGQSIVLPYDNWPSIRTSASSLKKNFGAEFKIHKMSGHGEIGDICVYRVK